MGKATITNNMGGGQYQIDFQYDITAVTNKIIGLTGAIDGLNAYLPTLISEKNTIKSKIDALNAELNQAIGNAEDLPALTAITTSIAKLSPSYQIVISKINRTNLQIDSYKKEKTYLQNNVNASKSMTAWCADFSDELTGDVGTIEIDGDHDKGVLIYPAGCVGLYAAYNPAIHGKITPSIASTPANCYVNKAIFPAWQKYKPTFRLGEITSKNGDFCDVNLDASISKEQNLDVNQSTTLSNVPIEYYCCDGDVFADGDRVVIAFEGQDWETPKVIGFESNPLPCEYDFIIKAQNTDYEAVSSGNSWGIRGTTDSTTMGIMNLNWRGRYVDGKPTLHLAWKGGNGRYFHTPSEAKNSPDNGEQLELVRLPDIFKNGVFFALAPVNVLGAAIQDIADVDYLYVIGVDDKIYRTLANELADVTTRVWTLMGVLDLSIVGSSSAWRNDWFFNGAGTAAVSVQYDGPNTTEPLRQAVRFRANIVDTVMSLDTFTLEFIVNTGEADNMTKAGNIAFAMDYKDDVIVQARVKVTISKSFDLTWSNWDYLFEYEIAGNTFSHYEYAGSTASQLIPDDPEDNYELVSSTTTRQSTTGILYMDLRYDVSIAVTGSRAVPYSMGSAGSITTKLYIRQEANVDEIDFLDENGSGFMFNFGANNNGLAVNDYGNIYLIRDSLSNMSFMSIVAATSINGGSLVCARNTAYAQDPSKTLFTGGMTATELIGTSAFWGVGSLR